MTEACPFGAPRCRRRRKLPQHAALTLYCERCDRARRLIAQVQRDPDCRLVALAMAGLGAGRPAAPPPPPPRL